MDDNNTKALTESQYEWAVQLTNILQPHIYDGIMSIFKEAEKICIDTDEQDKYLMTFQNFLARIPKWNPEIIQSEVTRIVDESRCNYIGDLITCVHIVHLKLLTAVRPSKSQKKINIDIPSLNPFIHKVYIILSRAFYENVFLFEQGIPPLAFQKNRREINTMIRTGIMDAVRESIPVSHLLRTYLDETTEIVKEEKRVDADPEVKVDGDEVKVGEVKVGEVKVDEVKVDEVKVDEVKVVGEERDEKKRRISFSDVDHAITVDNLRETISAPKDIETLETLSTVRNAQRKADEDDICIGEVIDTKLDFDVV